MERDNLTKLIDNLLEENKELKEKVRKLENENNFLKINNPDIKPNQPLEVWYGGNNPTDVYGNPVPYCSSSTTVVSCL